MTKQEKLAHLNGLRAVKGLDPLTSWKQSGEKLDELIAKLEAELADQVKAAPEAEQSAPEESFEATEATEAELALQADRPKQSAEEPSEPTEPVAVIPRGAIQAMCVEMLQTEMSYDAICQAIRDKYPTARTTPRSLASVAMDLRADGVKVPTRRPAKKAVEAPQQAAEG